MRRGPHPDLDHRLGLGGNVGKSDALGKGRDASEDIASIERLQARAEAILAAGAAGLGMRGVQESGVAMAATSPYGVAAVDRA